MNHSMKKYLVIALFVLCAVLSAVTMGRVAINYNLSDYLDDSTQTKISLDLIENEFGMTGDIQVMAENVSQETARDICRSLKGISNVLTVNFDETSENYYRDGKALFTVIVDGDEYSDTAAQVAADIKSTLEENFSQEFHLGGAVMEKQDLRSAIENEMVWILGISICLVAAIMLLTSQSWIEPLILLSVSGIAVLLNMGTNVFLGEISYITNSVAAILQLALSIDYSIVLLHHYRAVKNSGTEQGAAMRQAVKEVIKPVSASALTTIAGLLALLFMTFKIGFDIGIVLIKGIVISAITSLTLLPSLLLVCDRACRKTGKKALTLKGKGFCRLSFRANKAIVPIALCLILVCGILQTGNTYSFSDTKAVSTAIESAFGQNNALVVVYERGSQDEQLEQALINRLSGYRKADGTPVLKNYAAYTNTVREPYDIERAVQKLGLCEKDVELLFTMYRIYEDSTLAEMSAKEFTEYADHLLESDQDAQSFADDETSKLIRTLLAIDEMMNSELTAEEFYAMAVSDPLNATELDLFSVKQIYGLYYYEQIDRRAVDFQVMLGFLEDVADRPECSKLFDGQTAADLKVLRAGLEQFDLQMETPLTKAELQGYLYANYGVVVSEEQADLIWAGYFLASGEEPGDSIPFLKLMSFLADQGLIADVQAQSEIASCRALYGTIHREYAYKDFLPALSQIAEALTGQAVSLNASDDAIQQIYILYFYELDVVPSAPILGRTLLEFVIQTHSQNEVISSMLSDDVKRKLDDMLTADGFLQNPQVYDFRAMAEEISALQGKMISLSSSVTIGSDQISGVYIKYAAAERLATNDPIMACQLLEFLDTHMDDNELLAAKMDRDSRDRVLEAKQDMESAEALFLGERYARMLLSVDLPNESEESAEFADYLSRTAREIFGENAHIAGEIVSTRDLKETFDRDNLFISIFTIVSIFLIVMLIFRSLSLPVVLVAVIQGAIWISMSASLLTGDIFFMSYIVATCILMGATIDYGILMSTNYVQYRTTMDRKTALYQAVEAAMPTVFTSGMILTICGFVIGFIASQSSISTVGFLIGKGALVSVLMITLVLPSVLYLLDGFILKLSWKKKS